MPRRSRTRDEYVASLRWNIQDATEALQNAVGMRRWDTVLKYAQQLKTLESKLAVAEHTRPRVERIGHSMATERTRRYNLTAGAREERRRLHLLGYGRTAEARADRGERDRSRRR